MGQIAEVGAVRAIHGLPRTEIPKLKEAFGARFKTAIVVREPIARLDCAHKWRFTKSFVEGTRGTNLKPLLEAESIAALSEESRMFGHAANMLNAVTEEISLGTIYKAEDLNTTHAAFG
jgi:hypothetical protein